MKTISLLLISIKSIQQLFVFLIFLLYIYMTTTQIEPYKLTRTYSIEAQHQGFEGTCYAHASARVITKLISKLVPKFFTIDETEINSLYDKKKKTKENKNCFITEESTQISKIRKILDPTLSIMDTIKRNFINDYSKYKCPIKGKYNTLIMYFYTMLTNKRNHGCNGAAPIHILNQFVESFNSDVKFNTQDFYNLSKAVSTKDGLLGENPSKQGYIISESVDKICREILSEFSNFVVENKIVLDVKSYSRLTDEETMKENWITKFPDEAKEALNNGLYVLFDFCLTKEQWNYIGKGLFLPNSNFNCDKKEKDQNKYKIKCHSAVITSWRKDETTGICYVTIINSWGIEWGESGVIEISSDKFSYFVLNGSCGNRNINFLYFTIGTIVGEKDNYMLVPYTFPSVQMGTIYKTLSEWGRGKSKKRKHIKKRKSKKK